MSTQTPVIPVPSVRVAPSLSTDLAGIGALFADISTRFPAICTPGQLRASSGMLPRRMCGNVIFSWPRSCLPKWRIVKKFRRLTRDDLRDGKMGHAGSRPLIFHVHRYPLACRCTAFTQTLTAIVSSGEHPESASVTNCINVQFFTGFYFLEIFDGQIAT